MALTHSLFLSSDSEPWQDLAHRVFSLIAGDLHVEVLESGAITTTFDGLQISAMAIDHEDGSSLAEDVGFAPMAVLNFRAPGERSRDLDVFTLRIAARCIRARIATKVGLCRNFHSKFLIHEAGRILAFGLDAIMYKTLIEELGEHHGFEITVERWLDE